MNFGRGDKWAWVAASDAVNVFLRAGLSNVASFSILRQSLLVFRKYMVLSPTATATEENIWPPQK